jgi:hypothetical protein
MEAKYFCGTIYKKATWNLASDIDAQEGVL